MYCRTFLALFALSLGGAAPLRVAAAQTCDTDVVRVRAQEALPEYTVDAVRVERDIVTILFSTRHGAGRFAAALHASGTRLATSVMGAQIDPEDLAGASASIAGWWHRAELQEALAACCEAIPEGSTGDLGVALGRAAEAALGRHRGAGSPGLGAWIASLSSFAPIRQLVEEARVPRAIALALALFQVAILAAVIGRGVARFSAATPGVSAISWIALLAIAASALVVARRFGGPSASVWSDTFNDQAEVQRCLERSECTIYGMGTSVPGFVHAGGWLQLRDLMSALGLSMDGQILLLQILDALGVMLAAMVAWRLGGPLAAAIATWAMWGRYGAVSVAYYALYNSLPLAFLGAVFLVACVDAAERPSARSIAATGLVGAILANVHFVGISSGITSALVGLFAPRRRARFVVVGAAAFALATVAISPATWLHAVSYVLSHPAGERHEIARALLSTEPLVVDAFWLIAVWLAMLALRARVGDSWRRLDVLVAIVAPPLALFALAAAAGRINPTGKYVTQLRAPVAVMLATVTVACLSAIARLGFPSISRVPPRWRSRGQTLMGLAPYLGALAILTRQPTSAGPVLRLRDVAAAARVVRDDLRWDFATAIRSVEGPDNRDVLAAWKLMYPDWARAAASSDGRDDGVRAVLLHVPGQDLPEQIPSNWRIVSSSGSEATLLAMVPSWIDWTHYTVCLFHAEAGPEYCVDASLVDRSERYTIEVPAMPDSGDIPAGEVLQIRLPLRRAAPGEKHVVFMPQHPSQMCSGRIVDVPVGSSIEREGRQATLVSSSAGTEAQTLSVEWDLGACLSGYSGFPPFFVEGDADTVRPLIELMRRSWER